MTQARSKPRHSGAHHAKRHGQHQRQTKPFLKTYLPYLPLLAILAVGFLIGFRQPAIPARHVLAYATSVNSATLLAETNQQRASHRQTPLKNNDRLAAAAQAKANDMAKRNYWSHTTPDGAQPWSFLDKAGYGYQKAGENLAYGFNSSQAAVVGWMNSPSHRANLLDSGFKEVGFGFANAANFRGNGQETVVVAMYGSRQADDAVASAGSTSQAVRGQTAVGSVAATRTYRIARIQVITMGKAPWSIALLIAAATLGTLFIAIKHSLKLHRWVRQGEKFVLTHKLFDVTVLAFIALCVYATHAAGYILSASL